MDDDSAAQDPGQRRLLIVLAWSSILLVSDLPDVLLNAAAGGVPGWLPWGKVGLLAGLLALCSLWARARPLRPYAVVMLVLFAGLAASGWASTTAWWAGFLREVEPTFAVTWLRPFVRDAGVTLAVLAALWLVKRRRSAFYMVKGQLDAPIEPVRWLGIGPGESWRVFGWIFAGAAALAVAIPTLLALRPSAAVLGQAVPLLPAAMLLAAINAFNEELYFRASLLSTLPQVIGRNQALLITVALFGLAHYLYGSPPGVIGALMTGFLAYLLGKSMLETRGLAWPWLIHFLPDVVIFFSYAVDWVG